MVLLLPSEKTAKGIAHTDDQAVSIPCAALGALPLPDVMRQWQLLIDFVVMGLRSYCTQGRLPAPASLLCYFLPQGGVTAPVPEAGDGVVAGFGIAAPSIALKPFISFDGS